MAPADVTVSSCRVTANVAPLRMSRVPSLTPQWKIWGLVVGAFVVQTGLWVVVRLLGVDFYTPGLWLQLAVVWIVILLLAAIATDRIQWLTRMLTRHETAHMATLDLVGQLEIQNGLLKTLARSNDIGLAFQALARQIARLVDCNRIGLALVKEDGQTLQTFTARVADDERRHRPRPDLEFTIDRTLIGGVLRSREPLLTNDLGKLAADFLDANVLHGAGFRSALVMPLIAKNRALGTLNLVSRSSGAFVVEHIGAIGSVAEILAVGILAQQLQVALGKYRTMETMADLTLSISNEINGAVQAIIGHCDVLEREQRDPALQRDLALVIGQAQRISDLLEKMRLTTQDRLREVAATVHDAGIPSSPEELPDRTPAD